MSELLKQQGIAEQLQQAIDTKKIDVPMLPEVANKALVLSQNPEATAAEMAKLIQGDQALAAHVMRIANSVAYTPMANLVSLQQAIARLGMMTISEIAITASIGAKLFNAPGFESRIAGIWQHALATGLWAKEIARHMRSNVEVAFLAGLLHSIGRPAVLQTIIDLARKSDIELSLEEVSQLEADFHHQVSQMIVHAWQMPTLVIAAVCDYEDYQNSETAVTQAAQVNASIALADFILSETEQDEGLVFSLPVLASLNLYQDEVEKLLSQAELITEKMKELAA